MKYVAYLLVAIIAIGAVAFLGLLVKPGRFAEAPSPAPQPARLVAIPADLPTPVARWMRTEYPDGLPAYDSLVMDGRGTMRIGSVALPFRHWVEIKPGVGFLRKMDLTCYNVAFLHGLDTFVEGIGFMQTPVGPASGPHIDQGANVVSWLEALASPGTLAENPRVSWEAIDEDTARLYFPHGADRDHVDVTFDPTTGEPIEVYAERYRGTEDATKTGWTAHLSQRRTFPGGVRASAHIDAQWAGDPRPWAEFDYDAVTANAPTPGYDAAATTPGAKNVSMGDAR